MIARRRPERRSSLSRWLLTACLLAVPLTARADDAGEERPWVSVEALRARYGGVRAFVAEADQLKEARYLARPLRSRVRLELDGGRIEWRTLSPVASTLVIDADGLHVQTDGQADRAMGTDPAARAFAGLLRNVFVLDFEAMGRDFDLRFAQGTLTAVPKADSALAGALEAIEMSFDRDLDLQTVEVRLPGETTRLEFDRFDVR